MGLLSKIQTKTINKTSDKIATKLSNKIVDKMFSKDKESSSSKVSEDGNRTNYADANAQPAPAPQYTPEQQAAMAAAQRGANEKMSYAMGMAYNTKKCPECQAVCFNSPAECPYCHADLKAIKPLTPEELEALSKDME